jgi:MOSC domain-containing protein YiiM
MTMSRQPVVHAVCSSATHTMAKPNRDCIHLLEGIGVQGDAHAGKTVQHRSRVARNPSEPNLRQVHLMQAELLVELRASGFDVHPGRMGENITTSGLDLLGLPAGTRLKLGESAVLEITGLRNPCRQLDGIQPRLMSAVLDKDARGHLIRKAGVMAVVLSSGDVRPGDAIQIELPPEPHHPLECV